MKCWVWNDRACHSYCCLEHSSTSTKVVPIAISNKHQNKKQKRLHENHNFKNNLSDRSSEVTDNMPLCGSFIPSEEDPKTLAEVAQSCSKLPGPTSPTHEKEHRSLAEAAMAYQETVSTPKGQAQLAYVNVVTGEEEERNVLKVKKCCTNMRKKVPSVFSWYMFLQNHPYSNGVEYRLSCFFEGFFGCSHEVT